MVTEAPVLRSLESKFWEDRAHVRLDAGSVVDAHKIFVEQMNLISPLSRNGTNISKLGKMPSAVHQPP